MRIYRAANFILLVLLFCFQLMQCKKTKEVESEGRITIGIVNPNAGSLKGLKDLIKNDIFSVSNLKILAINYERAERDIDAVEEFIQNDDTGLFFLERIDGELNQNTLFIENDLTVQFKQLFEKTDGIIFLGGADFPPAIYEAKTSLLTNINTPYRHYFELSFLFHLIGGYQDQEYVPLLESNPDYPVIGFCLGMQSINVACGGSMFQDIPMDIYGLKYVDDVLSLDPNQQHLNYWQKLNPDNQMLWANFHQIKSIKNHTFFDRKLWSKNPTPYIYSSHHQAVRDLGQNIEILATSLDGKVPEIIGHQKYRNVFGVQFHPEVSSIYDPNGKKFYWTPNDTTHISYNTYLQKTNSLKFHLNFWNKMGEVFTKH